MRRRRASCSSCADLDRARAAKSSCWRRPAARRRARARARTAGTMASVRPGHSSRSWPYSAPTRNLKASKPKRSRSRTKRAASSLGRDVALHRRGIGAQRPRRAAEQLAHRLALRACRAGPTARYRGRRSRGTGASRGTCARARRPGRPARRCPARRAQHPRRDLPVQDQCADVGVVGRDLAPALAPSSVVTRTKPTKGVQKVSMRLIFMRARRSGRADRAARSARPGVSDRSILNIS